MKNVFFSKADNLKLVARVLRLSFVGIISFLMVFGFATSANAAMLTRQLEFGMRGQDVSDLQTFLALDRTIYPQGLVTGYFGYLTKAAVSNFQSRNGIATVGRVGPITLAAINQQMNGDNNAPFINSLNVNPSSTGATLTWNTSENASAIVYYSTTPLAMTEANSTMGVIIGGSSLVVHNDLRSSHTAVISALNSNTTYYYVVYVKDATGNESITWPSTFHTN